MWANVFSPAFAQMTETETEKDIETLRCTVRVFMKQQRMRFFCFSFQRGHTDRNYLLIVKEQKQDKFQLQYHIHPVLSWSGPMERFSLGFGVAQIDPHTCWFHTVCEFRTSLNMCFAFVAMLFHSGLSHSVSGNHSSQLLRTPLFGSQHDKQRPSGYIGKNLVILI